MPNGSLYDKAIDFATGEWMEPKIQFDAIFPHGNAGEYCGNVLGWMLLPGRLESLVLATQAFLKAGLSTLLIGSPSSGKSTIINVLRNGYYKRYAVVEKL